MANELNQNNVIRFSLKNKSCEDAISENGTDGDFYLYNDRRYKLRSYQRARL
jgi:hypothetical protein